MDLNNKCRDYSVILIKEHYLDIGEAEAISLLKQENIQYFFTDDWYARDVAKEFKLQVHGTLGIVIRAYREGMINKSTAYKIMDNLYKDSSLFITSKIINKGKSMLEKFEKQWFFDYPHRLLQTLSHL